MSIYYEMTGSPRTAGFKTKAELIAHLKELGYVKDDLAGAGHGKSPEQVCNLLLTDSYDSKSGKMTKAKKLGIRILTYEDLLKELDENDTSARPHR
jgi:hypothetical protein